MSYTFFLPPHRPPGPLLSYCHSNLSNCRCIAWVACFTYTLEVRVTGFNKKIRSATTCDAFVFVYPLYYYQENIILVMF